ncbi:MAG TPA: long-chain fatty acid--CoA ligase [Marmoricola sp.]|nr:long-chain fatty acid--CoA ligase [Marmoricola sp.]
MREYSTPPTSSTPTTGNLTDDLLRNAADEPDRVAVSRRGPSGWTGVTAAQLLAEVRRTAKGLVAAGIAPGDRVALVSKTRYEWTLLDYAIWYVGGVTVPVYETSAADQLAWLLANSGARAVVVETSTHADRVEEASGHAELAVEHVWVIDGADDRKGAVAELTELGGTVDDAALEARREAVGPGSVATIIYTSGTTGPPKGCVLTHDNFLVELSTATDELAALFDEDDASTLLFLPLAHVFARIVQVGAIRKRVRLGHTADVRHLLDDLAEFRPTFVLGVPRVFEKIFNSASQRAASDGRGKLFDRATDVAIAYSRALDAGRPGPVLRARHALDERLVYARLRESLGGSCRHVISGGAPLGERLGHFFRGIGIPVIEGYGLTETTAAITVNPPDALRIGTVGRPLPGATVRVDDDGELLVRGGQVMQGYWQDEAATAAVLSPDGWLRTGDLAEIDAEGYVRVTGRRKEILVTAGGKNVAPGPLEDRVRAHHLVSQCMVVGDGRPYVAALLTLDPEAVEEWADRHQRTRSLTRLAHDPELVAEVQAAVNEANATVSKAESIRRFTILPVDWTEEGGQLTPSLKLRRHLLMRDFRAEIETLYD